MPVKRLPPTPFEGELLDFRGHQIKVGCRILYPTQRSDCLYLSEATVVKIERQGLYSWQAGPGNAGQVVLRVRFVGGSRDGYGKHSGRDRSKLITIMRVDSVAVITTETAGEVAVDEATP